MSFGLTNAIVAFMYLMNCTFQDFIDHFVIMFTNEILIYLSSPKEHVRYLEIVLQVLSEKELHARLSKCEFWLQKISFLDHSVTKDGISIDYAKVEVIVDWPRL